MFITDAVIKKWKYYADVKGMWTLHIYYIEVKGAWVFPVQSYDGKRALNKLFAP